MRIMQVVATLTQTASRMQRMAVKPEIRQSGFRGSESGVKGYLVIASTPLHMYMRTKQRLGFRSLGRGQRAAGYNIGSGKDRNSKSSQYIAKPVTHRGFWRVRP